MSVSKGVYHVSQATVKVVAVISGAFLIGIFSLFFFLSQHASAKQVQTISGAIGVVDMQQVMVASHQVQQQRTALKKKFEAKHEQLMAEATTMKQDFEQLAKDSKTMAKNQINAKRSELLQHQEGLQKEQAAFQKSVFAAQEKAMHRIMTQIKSVVRTVARKHGFKTVLAKAAAIYSAKQNNLTQEVITTLNH
jgi:Skp family chaperone for outer membrane proteins